jgi:PAS domain-containing protein
MCWVNCGTSRRLNTLQKQVEAGGPVAVGGECAQLGQAIAQLLERQHAELASRDQQMAMVLQAEARTRLAAQAVLDDSPHALALLSPSGRVELVNARGTWFGLETDKPIDGSPHVWLKDLLAETIQSRQRTKLKPGQGGEGNAANLSPENNKPQGAVQIFKDGQELFFLPEALPLLDAKGLLTGVILVLADVTPLRQTEAPGAKLLSWFSHEIRTPMTSLQMSLYLLLDDAATRLTPRQLELLRAARDDADRLHRIIEDALTRWKSERDTGKQP